MPFLQHHSTMLSVSSMWVPVIVTPCVEWSSLHTGWLWRKLLEWGVDHELCCPLAHGNHKDGAKRISNSAIRADHCYQRVTFELHIQFEMAIVSDHTSHYFKIFKLHLNPISDSTVPKPQLYYIWTMDCLHLNRLQLRACSDTFRSWKFNIVALCTKSPTPI